MRNKIFKLLLLTIFFGVWQTAVIAQNTFTETARLTANDGVMGDRLGFSVAVSGNTAVVGAPLADVGGNSNQGAAYVYVRGANGSWTQQAKLTPSDGVVNRGFGLSVAIDNDTVFVGTSNTFFVSQLPGATYVFTRTGAVWTQAQKIIPNDSAGGDYFGSSLAVSGDNLIIGADFGAGNQTGAAYVFVKNSSNVWTQQAKLIASDGAAVNYFGVSVALEGETAVVGAIGARLGLGFNNGAAYIFSRSGTTWTQRQKIAASDFASRDEFGISVGISGSTILVGSHFADANQRIDGGAVYVFNNNGGTWTQQQKLTPNANTDGFWFGTSLALKADTAIIGANRSRINGNSSRGAAFVFRRSGTTWTLNQQLTASDGEGGDEFGNSVALSGGTAIIGAFLDDISPSFGQGSAYIFQTPQAGAPRTSFDFDGDGKADQTVFRPSDRVWYLLRSSSGFSAAQFGLSSDKIVPADFDGDGKSDIAVYRDGVWYWLNSSTGSFNAFHFGIASDIPVPADYTGDGRAELAVYRAGIWYTWNLANSQFNAVQFGISTDKPVSADYDGDGKTDIAVVRQTSGLSSWYILGTSQGFYGLQWGTDTDKLVPADYDGDGKADVAVYRNGFWYVLGSTQGFFGIHFGNATDIPVAADYDGDGKTDVAVFRDGVWYLLRSQQGFGAVQFGTTNDRPIPAAFVP